MKTTTIFGVLVVLTTILVFSLSTAENENTTMATNNTTNVTTNNATNMTNITNVTNLANETNMTSPFEGAKGAAVVCPIGSHLQCIGSRCKCVQ